MTDGQGYRIWIVEDDDKLASLLADVLKRYGYGATRACDYANLRTEARQAQPDLILLDVNLPQQVMGLTLFIGAFLGLLFALALASLFYFKLFIDLRDDQGQFMALRRLGVSRSENDGIVAKQIFGVFFWPLAGTGVNAGFAYAMFGHLLAKVMKTPVVSAADLIVFLAYAAIVFAAALLTFSAYRSLATDRVAISQR